MSLFIQQDFFPQLDPAYGNKVVSTVSCTRPALSLIPSWVTGVCMHLSRTRPSSRGQLLCELMSASFPRIFLRLGGTKHVQASTKTIVLEWPYSFHIRGSIGTYRSATVPYSITLDKIPWLRYLHYFFYLVK